MYKMDKISNVEVGCWQPRDVNINTIMMMMMIDGAPGGIQVDPTRACLQVGQGC